MLFEDIFGEEELEYKYDRWLFQNCECDMQTNGCSCLSYEEWAEIQQEAL